MNYTEEVRAILSDCNTSKTAYVRSFGCQQNVSDGERISGILSDLGYGITDCEEKADLIIYNTCAVRENAELKVFSLIGELKHLKDKNPDLIIGLCGCMAQESHVAEKIKKTYKQVDLVFGTFAMESIPELVYEVLSNRKFVLDISEEHKPLAEGTKVLRESTYKASVPVMYGCNNFCTYCIVPYVRGREKSRRHEDILNEVRGLVRDGYKEIMLLGQNVNSYGNDLKEGYTFANLLHDINDIEGDFIVRFMSSHPKDATPELIDAILDCEKIAKHLHLPVQSGSSQMLKAMNRHYTREKYLETIRYARKRNPDFSFSSDIIVGFPNESKEDFAETISLLKEVRYDNVFSFIYSKRTGTKAALIDDKISYEEKTERMKELLSTQRAIAEENYKRFIGRTLRVLPEGKSKRKGFLTGKSNEFIIVEFEGSEDLIGSFVDVEITDSHYWELVGKIK